MTTWSLTMIITRTSTRCQGLDGTYERFNTVVAVLATTMAVGNDDDSPE